MPVEKQRKARPAIKPIKTNVANWEGSARKVSTPSRFVLHSASPRSPRLRVVAASPLVEAKQDGWYHVPERVLTILTPVVREPATPGLPRIEGLGLRDRTEEPASAVSQTAETDGSCSTPRGRRLSSQVPAWNLVQFQRYRASLWRRGKGDFRKHEGDYLLVNPVELKKNSPAAGEGRHLFQAVLHSKGQGKKLLTREFDLRELRATIPDPLPSPRPPNPERSSSLLVPAPSERGTASPTSTPSPGPASDEEERPRGKGREVTAIHAPYARAFLPVLASIMMSARAQLGNRIDLPMPHPDAWFWTARYVYMGQEKDLTEAVKQNIRYLGGKV
ncbi:hypothetical protein CDD83_3682 [Cordyceps sp. RAO-2017]|nr:hypothetical protein CDD83_3682 [Cordyceps sp. RAO-2017]